MELQGNLLLSGDERAEQECQTAEQELQKADQLPNCVDAKRLVIRHRSALNQKPNIFL